MNSDKKVIIAAIKTYLGIDSRAFAKVIERYNKSNEGYNCQVDYLDILAVVFPDFRRELIIQYLTNDEQEYALNEIINDPTLKALS